VAGRLELHDDLRQPDGVLLEYRNPVLEGVLVNALTLPDRRATIST